MRGIVLSAALAALAAAKIPIILDTDIATDFDDTWALHYLLARNDMFDVKLVQVSTFNTTKRGQVAANILATLGRFDVPVGIGRYTGEQNMPQYPIAASYTLDDFTAAGGTVYQGTAYMSQLMAASDPTNPTFVVEIAPATSLGDVLSADPGVSKNVIVVAMSGSIYHGYGNSSQPEAEYNVKTDIGASQWVYNSTWLSPLATAPLDTTVFDQFCNPEYLSLLAANDTAHPYVVSLMANYQTWMDNGGHFGGIKPYTLYNGTSTLYDLQAAYMTGYYGAWYASKGGQPSPSFPEFITQTLPVYVDGQGFTRVGAPGLNVWPAVGFTPNSNGVEGNVDQFAADVVAALILAPLGGK